MLLTWFDCSGISASISPQMFVLWIPGSSRRHRAWVADLHSTGWHDLPEVGGASGAQWFHHPIRGKHFYCLTHYILFCLCWPFIKHVMNTASLVEATGQTKDQMVRFYLHAGLGTPWDPPVRSGKGSLWFSAGTVTSVTPLLIGWMRIDGWI